MITVRAAQRSERAAPAREERARPDLRVVDDHDVASTDAGAERRSAGVVASMLIVLLFVCVFGVVVFQVFLVQTQSRLDQIDRDIAKQEKRTKDLRLETANLETPDRIVRDAKDRLGMIPPQDIVYLQPNAADDGRAQFDPAKENPPTPATTVPAPVTKWTAPPTIAPRNTPTTAKAVTPTTKAATPTTVKATTPTTISTTVPRKR